MGKRKGGSEKGWERESLRQKKLYRKTGRDRKIERDMPPHWWFICFVFVHVCVGVLGVIGAKLLDFFFFFFPISTYSRNANNNSAWTHSLEVTVLFWIFPQDCSVYETENKILHVVSRSPYWIGANANKFAVVTQLIHVKYLILSAKLCPEFATTSSPCHRIPWCPRQRIWRWCS